MNTTHSLADVPPVSPLAPSFEECVELPSLPYVREETFRLCLSITLILMALSLMWGICFILCKIRTRVVPERFEENLEMNFIPRQRADPTSLLVRLPDVVAMPAGTVNAHGE